MFSLHFFLDPYQGSRREHHLQEQVRTNILGFEVECWDCGSWADNTSVVGLRQLLQLME